MLNRDRTRRQYRLLEPDKLPPSNLPPPRGTNAEVLADGLLDIIQLALETGMTLRDVEEAMREVDDTLAWQQVEQDRKRRATE